MSDKPVRAAQAGWKVVPAEPTPDWIDAYTYHRPEMETEKAAQEIRIMLAAAPSGEPLMADEDLILSQLKRIAELEDLVYVPGLWRCAKCKCGVTSQILNVARGDVRANNEPQQCPNGCGPLWRVTERDAGNELADRMNDTRNATLEQVQRLVMSYVKSPKATVVHFLGKVDADIREAELAPKRVAAAEIVKLIDTLKGPA